MTRRSIKEILNTERSRRYELELTHCRNWPVMKMASKHRSIQARKFKSDFKPDIHLRPHTNFHQKSNWRSKKHSQVSGQFEKTLKQYKDRKMTEKLMYFPVIHRAFSHSRLPYILRDTVSVFLNHRQWHSDKFFYGWEEKKTTNRRKVSIRVFSGHFCVLVLCYATLSTTH